MVTGQTEIALEFFVVLGTGNSLTELNFDSSGNKPSMSNGVPNTILPSSEIRICQVAILSYMTLI